VLEDDAVRKLYGIPRDCNLVYTDGSCLGSYGGNCKAGIGVYFGRNDPRNISSRLPGSLLQTSGTAESYAIYKALETLNLNFTLYSDGVFLLTDYKSVVDLFDRPYSHRVERRISLNEGFQRIRSILADLKEKGIHVQFKHVPGHKGILGNEIADILAKKGSVMPQYNGENFECGAFDIVTDAASSSGRTELKAVEEEMQLCYLGDMIEGTNNNLAFGDQDDSDGMGEEMYEDENDDVVDMVYDELLYADDGLDQLIAKWVRNYF
jgi:ribonuclease HI